MSLYDLMYNFLINNIWNNADLSNYVLNIGPNTINMNVWLSHTTTIIFIALLLIVLVIAIKGMFNLFARLFRFR